MIISVIVPLFNEESLITEIVIRFGNFIRSQQPSLECELIFIDDGSTDKTLASLKRESQNNKLSCKIITFRRNFGHYNAIYAGLAYCSGDYIILIDGDLQDPPEIIPQLIDEIQNGNYDLVYAKRISRQDNFLKKLLSKAFYKTFNALSPITIPEDIGIFRCMTKEVKNILLDFPENDYFLLGLMEYPGFTSGFVNYQRDERSSGVSKYNFFKSFKLAWQGLTSFTTFPLMVIKYTGYGLAFSTLLYVMYIIIRKLIFGFAVLGWAGIITMTGTLFSVNFIFLGIFGEYLAKLIKEVKKRPNYYVKEVIDLKGD